MEKILCVDSKREMIEQLKGVLVDYEVLGASDGKSALRLLCDFNPDIVMTDLAIPEMNGFELCRQIRLISLVPIIVLSNSGDVGNIQRALSMGGDEYLVKPMNGQELISRVKALLRRSLWPAPSQAPETYVDPLLRVDYSKREVFVQNKLRDLTNIEYCLLILLVQNCGHAVSLDYLLKNIWGAEYQDVSLVKWHMVNLRIKIRIDPSNKEEVSPIVTIRGYGYRYERPSN